MPDLGSWFGAGFYDSASRKGSFLIHTSSIIGCDLCGLPVRSDAFDQAFEDRTYRFCCAGCRMVFTMLMEAADAPDPSRFKESDLYRECVAAGVVPASEEDLERINRAAEEKSAAQDASDERATLAFEAVVEGMWCPACAWVIGHALERLDGIREVACDFSTDRLRCRYDPVRTAPVQIRQRIERLGYRALSDDGSSGEHALRSDFVRLAITALLSANVMMLSWSLYSGFFTELTPKGIAYISWPIFVMATIAMAYGGGPVLRKAWSGVRHAAPGMEVLIMLGAGSAYLYSLVNWWRGSLHLYFDTASMLITLLLLGKLLEARAKQRVRQDLEGFLSLQPTKVRLCSDAFPKGRYVHIDQLGAGDLFKVGPGEVVPADGRIVAGGGRLDASAITGEPEPVALEPGDGVTSGSRVVSGDLTVRAEQVGDRALLGQMIAVVRKGLAQRTALESRTDRWLAAFVPIIALLALATGTVGYLLGLSMEQALVRTVTVLVIACPCALGIAIPLARVVGIAGAGRQGLLVRDFDAFEQAGGIDTVVFDKTGTVTRGQWTLERIERQGDLSEAFLLALALGLEAGVDHAVAHALRTYAGQRGVEAAEVTDVQACPDGLRGRYRGQIAQIGSGHLVTGKKDPTGHGADENASDAAVDLSVVLLSLDGTVQAGFYFGDTLREGMAEMIQQLKRRGLTPHLLSGDAAQATMSVAAAIGIENATGRLLPHEKADYVETLQTGGRRVAMIGDGVNDAPALACADLAVAVHSGSPLARHAAGVTLMQGDPSQLLDFLNWAARVDRKVSQNLWCALVYNAVSIPVAMAGLLSPLVAVTAMLLSSLTVIGNTLLLVRR